MEMFMGSLARALPADDSDYADKAFSTQDGPIPLEDLHPAGNGGYVFWDNGAYVEVFVHVAPGEWQTIEPENEDGTSPQYDALPEEIRAAYRRLTGGQDFPGAGEGMKRVIARQTAGEKKPDPSN